MRALCLSILVSAAAFVAAQEPAARSSLQLQARVSGTGEPVVLLGGGLLGADGWGGVPAEIARTHRAINAQSLVVQYGLEDRPLPADYSIRTEIDALRATVDALGVEAADVVGMSHGGVTALLFALEEPGRVRSLTLVEPPAFWVLPNHGHDDPGAHEMQTFVASLRGATITEAHVERFRCILGDCAGGRSPRQAPQWGQWVRYRNSLRGLYTIGDYDGDLARLQALTMPTLLVHGAGTVAFHRAINATLARTLPRAEMLELGGGHNSPAADPVSFVDAWRRFAERHR